MNRRRVLAMVLVLSAMTSFAPLFGEEPTPGLATPPSPEADGLRSPCPSPQQLSKWFRRIDSIRADISMGDRAVPSDCSTDLFQSGGIGHSARHVSVSTYAWVAPELWHQPIYFDDVPLEQYGQTKHPVLQPAISMGRFYLTIPAMPYKMAVDPPYSCVTTLGKYRPGSCAPCVLQVPR